MREKKKEKTKVYLIYLTREQLARQQTPLQLVHTLAVWVWHSEIGVHSRLAVSVCGLRSAAEPSQKKPGGEEREV